MPILQKYIPDRLTYSEEGIKSFFEKVKNEFTRKVLKDEEIKKIFNFFKPFINRNIVRVMIVLDENDKVILMTREAHQKSLKNFASGDNDFKRHKEKFEETIVKVNEYARPLMKRFKLKYMGFAFEVEKGNVLDIISAYEPIERKHE